MNGKLTYFYFLAQEDFPELASKTKIPPIDKDSEYVRSILKKKCEVLHQELKCESPKNSSARQDKKNEFIIENEQETKNHENVGKKEIDYKEMIYKLTERKDKKERSGLETMKKKLELHGDPPVKSKGKELMFRFLNNIVVENITENLDEEVIVKIIIFHINFF